MQANNDKRIKSNIYSYLWSGHLSSLPPVSVEELIETGLELTNDIN